jgi:hypothetical protein
MDLGSIFIALALALIAGAFILRPLIEHTGDPVTEQDRRLSALQAERDRILGMLEELEMDHAMGKVVAQDFQTQRAALVQAGVGVLKEMDALDAGPLPESRPGDLEAALEAEVARLRQGVTEHKAGFCAACGAALEGGDAFCARCGQAVATEEMDA